MSALPRVIRDNLWLQAAVVLAVATLVYLPNLGAGGLARSEGHRAVPAWELLDAFNAPADDHTAAQHRNTWLVPRLFGQPYLRKPPGVPQAMALSSLVFGETSFAVRFVSAAAACAMALLAWAIGTRWFGSPWGLAAGLAHALWPQMWESGRSAEIEALHNLACMAAGLGLLSLALPRETRGVRMSVAIITGTSLALFAMAWTKGPAGIAVVPGALVGAAIASRSWRAAVQTGVLAAIAGGAVLIAIGFGAVAMHAARLETEPVLQAPSAFLWNIGQAGRVALFPLAALAAALPVSLALLFPFGPDAQREARQLRGGTTRDLTLARALAWAVLVGIGVMTLAGTSNPRYALPITVLASPVVAYAVRGMLLPHDRSGAFGAKRVSIARLCTLGHPAVLGVGLAVGAAVFIAVVEPRVRATSGELAGRESADAIVAWLATPEGQSAGVGSALVLDADALIDARPETLHALRRQWAVSAAADATLPPLVIRWRPGWPALTAEETAPDLVALRVDDAGEPDLELEPARTALGGGASTPTSSAFRAIRAGVVHKYRFVIGWWAAGN